MMALLIQHVRRSKFLGTAFWPPLWNTQQNQRARSSTKRGFSNSLLACWQGNSGYQRPNNSFKPKPLRGSA